LLLALVAGLTLPLAAPVQAGEERLIPGRYIVVLKDAVDDPAAVARELTGRAGGRLRGVYTAALEGFAAELPARAVERLAADPRVAFVEQDQEVWATQVPGGVPSGVDRIEADQNPTARIDGADQRVDVDVAIIDTGISSHPDLPRVSGGVDCSFFGWCRSGYSDGNGHGTHVAGTVAALDNGTGVVGVAPGARLWAVKVLNSAGSGSVSSIVAGIDWVTARAGTIEVANMSLGCNCYNAAMDTALTRSTNAGVVYVAAAGNSALDTTTITPYSTPAGHPQVIGVTAIADYNGQPGGGAAPTCRTDPDDTLASFSNYGTDMDIAAPGVCINSTVPGGGYAEFSGTSMASPHVAGAAALWIVERGVAPGSGRWSAVREGLVGTWSTPQGGPCGFAGGRSPEPLLRLVAC
jgi:subtilisin family serine protease